MLRLKLFLPAAALALALSGMACSATDDGLSGATPTTSTGTPDGNDISDDLEESFNDLRDGFQEASDEAQAALSDTWDEIQETYDEWLAATEDERDDLAQDFDRLADEIRNALNGEDEADGSPTPGS